jgi:hypothetical protein
VEQRKSCAGQAGTKHMSNGMWNRTHKHQQAGHAHTGGARASEEESRMGQRRVDARVGWDHSSERRAGVYMIGCLRE